MISVALCTYNGEKYIREQLESILSQTEPVDEIVICDDRSSDRTVETAAGIRDSHRGKTRIRIEVNDRNLGVSKNFEKALSLCSGDIIFLSDQDDIWDPEKVRRVREALEKDPRCLLVFTDAKLIDGEGNDLGQSLWDVSKPRLKETYSAADFTGLRFITGATAAIRRELLEHTLPVPECWIHDAWLAINAAVYGGVAHLDEKLISYRQHEANVIGAAKRPLREQIRHTGENIGRSVRFRTTMKERFQSFLDRSGAALSEEDREEVRDCLRFWEESEKLGSQPVPRGLGTIARHLVKKKYRKYNHGIYGVMVDLFIVFGKKGAERPAEGSYDHQ